MNILYDRAATFLYYRAGTGALHAACVPPIENLPQTCVCAYMRVCYIAARILRIDWDGSGNAVKPEINGL